MQTTRCHGEKARSLLGRGLNVYLPPCVVHQHLSMALPWYLQMAFPAPSQNPATRRANRAAETASLGFNIKGHSEPSATGLARWLVRMEPCWGHSAQPFDALMRHLMARRSRRWWNLNSEPGQGSVLNGPSTTGGKLCHQSQQADAPDLDLRVFHQLQTHWDHASSAFVCRAPANRSSRSSTG